MEVPFGVQFRADTPVLHLLCICASVVLDFAVVLAGVVACPVVAATADWKYHRKVAYLVEQDWRYLVVVLVVAAAAAAVADSASPVAYEAFDRDQEAAGVLAVSLGFVAGHWTGVLAVADHSVDDCSNTSHRKTAEDCHS